MTDYDPSLIDEDSVDIQPWPTIELIGRGVALTTIARRGALEVDDDRDEFDLETDRFDLVTWARTELQNWVTDDELRLLNASIGELTDDDLSTCDNALVSATAIAWSINAVTADHLPLPEQESINERIFDWAPQPWDKVRSLQSRARIRSDEELAAERERWELWYWRATESNDDAESLAEVVAEIQESNLLSIVDGDFATDDGVPYTRLSEEQQDDVAWLAGLRLRSLNWVCGFGETWESAPLYLDD